MMKLILLFILIPSILAENYNDDPHFKIAWWDTDDNKDYAQTSYNRIPFPQCLVSSSKSNYFESSSIQKLFDKKIREEEENLKYEGYENYKHKNSGLMDYDAGESRHDDSNSRAAASAAIKLTRDIMTVLACDLNGTDTTNLNRFLSKFKMPEKFCTYRDQPNCEDKYLYRTITGVCNNLQDPYLGSSQTAFGRLVPSAYQDHLSEPRRYSVLGGLLPSCRKVSLALGSKPNFDRRFNNFFVIWGQFVAHDIALATPVTDTYLTPISSCTCSSKYDWNKCDVIPIQPDDPYLGGQKCMAFPATAQAFKNTLCTLSVKEQLNGNTHFIDLSLVYGSTLRTALALRSYKGLLKSTRRTWSKYELPPGQREGKSCSDGTSKRLCFAGGDSRLMENLLLTGIDAMYLRAHNDLVKFLDFFAPSWEPNMVYEEVRLFLSALNQLIFYGAWLPTLLGADYGGLLLNDIITTPYNPNVTAVVYNEVAVSAFRLHTLARDLFSRCAPDGRRIDQLWFNDISHKAKYAYDAENNGLDSILCGSFYDYGFAHDGYYAHQLRDRLFESVNKYGNYWRNDLHAINTCRGREHGIASYNAYRQYCNFTKAYYFEDFGDTINYDGIQLLKKLYKHPDDVDLHIALDLEDPLEGAIVGPVRACLLYKQFKDLCVGDRFCITNLVPISSASELTEYADLGLIYLICNTVDILQIPTWPFAPPSDDNPLLNCSTFNFVQYIDVLSSVNGSESDFQYGSDFETQSALGFNSVSDIRSNSKLGLASGSKAGAAGIKSAGFSAKFTPNAMISGSAPKLSLLDTLKTFKGQVPSKAAKVKTIRQ